MAAGGYRLIPQWRKSDRSPFFVITWTSADAAGPTMAAVVEQGAPAAMVAIMAAIDRGEIRVEGGTKKDVQKFFSYFDEPLDVGSINLIVR